MIIFTYKIITLIQRAMSLSTHGSFYYDFHFTSTRSTLPFIQTATCSPNPLIGGLTTVTFPPFTIKSLLLPTSISTFQMSISLLLPHVLDNISFKATSQINPYWNYFFFIPHCLTQFFSCIPIGKLVYNSLKSPCIH